MVGSSSVGLPKTFDVISVIARSCLAIPRYELRKFCTSGRRIDDEMGGDKIIVPGVWMTRGLVLDHDNRWGGGRPTTILTPSILW
jgi:hypothetical protein